MKFAPQMDRAWGLVTVGFIIALLSTGIRFAIGPFLVPMVTDFGFSRIYMSSVVAVGMLIFGLAMPLTGRLADRWGSRSVLLAGIGVVTAAFLMTAGATSVSMFVFSYGILASVGFAMTGQVVMTPLIGQWFEKRRGFAMTCLTSGSMSGIAIMTPLSTWLVTAAGWRETYFVFALIFLVLILPGVWFLVPGKPRLPAPAGGAPNTAPEAGRVSAAGSGPERGEPLLQGKAWAHALRTIPFWYLSLGMLACGFSMNLIGTHGVPMLQHHGHSPFTASTVIGTIGLVSTFGALAVGAASDRFGRKTFLAAIYTVRAVSFLALIFLSYQWELYLVAVIGGLVWTGSTALTAVIATDLYGPARIGTLAGILHLSHQVGAAMGSVVGGWGFELMGSYLVPFTVSAALLLIGAMASLRLPAAFGALPQRFSAARA